LIKGQTFSAFFYKKFYSLNNYITTQNPPGQGSSGIKQIQ